jgi:hypothetical protein
MLNATRGLVLAFAAFAASFVLHIIGGAMDQGWLFAVAVALVFIIAAGFPVVALLLGRPATAQARNVTIVAGSLIGLALTAATLWAANDRSFAWWHIAAVPALVAAVSGLLYVLLSRVPALRHLTPAT